VELDTANDQMRLGERRYFFVCNFPRSLTSASVTRSDGLTQEVELLASIPNPDLRKGSAEAVIDWSALPFHPTGMYTLTVTYEITETLNFWVEAPTKEQILTVPPSGPPGTTFQVYYVYFDLNTTPTFDFYGEDEPVEGGDHNLTYRRSWQIPITQPLTGVMGDKGWAQAPLVSAASDLPAAYAITYDYQGKGIFDLFWLR
jgi:hypothetical protein